MGCGGTVAVGFSLGVGVLSGFGGGVLSYN